VYRINTDTNRLTTSDYEKVEVLSSLFGSVYSKKSTGSVPYLETKKIYHEMKLPDITEELVEKLLKNLNVSKYVEMHTVPVRWDDARYLLN